jgi:hypothetical protein
MYRDSPLSPRSRTPVPSSSGPRRTGTRGNLTGQGSVIPVGTYTTRLAQPAPVVICEDPLLQRHLERPWFRAYLAHHLGFPVATPEPLTQQTATLSTALLARHGLAGGMTGSGKTRWELHIIKSLIADGHSVLAIDPKGELMDRLLAWAIASGLAPEQITLLDPRRPEAGVPGWNPALTGIPLSQAVRDFVDLLEQAHPTSWGPRLRDLLVNGLSLVWSHPNLSLYELSILLIDEAYREALLRQPVTSAEPLAYDVAQTFFQYEFGRLSRSERAQAIGPVLNKIRELLRSPFLRPLLCSARNTLSLPGLWQQPGLVLVRLDRTVLGLEGARLLGGMLVHALYHTALRVTGPTPVALVIDELPLLEKLTGGVLTEILAVARSQNLRVMVAFQHFDQLSESLRAALLGNTAIQAYFHMGYPDARLVAASLAPGTEPAVSRVTATVDHLDRETGLPAMSEWHHQIKDPNGRPLRLAPGLWQRHPPSAWKGRDGVRHLQALAAASGVSRLYVQTPDAGEPVELSHYVTGLPDRDYWIAGPAPLQLTVAFPRPRLTAVQRCGETEAARYWTRCLMELPVQHAVLRLAGSTPGVVRVVDVPAPQVDPARQERFVAAVMAANAQSPAEIEATLRQRQAAVERLAIGHSDTWEEPDDDDGSIA